LSQIQEIKLLSGRADISTGLQAVITPRGTADSCPVCRSLHTGNQKMRTAIVIIAILLFPTLASASTWLIDQEKSRIRFKVNHAMVQAVEGEFRRFSGVINLHDKDITRSELKVSVAMASVATDRLDLAEELRSSRFLDVARYPVMTLVSRKIVRSGAGRLRVTGDLNLHGVTREVVLQVQGPGAVARDSRGRMRRNAAATARISRKDFGLTWNELLAAGLSDNIDIGIEIELVRQ